MSNITGVGNFYGLRNWVESGLKPSKNELGWADFRLTSYTDLEKWWEIVCSAYLKSESPLKRLTNSEETPR